MWKSDGLTKSYVKMRDRLEKWLSRANGLDLEVAARESFLLGGEAIRQLVFDPLLPDPLADVNERRAFVQRVIEFDRRGHEIWRRLLSRNEAHGAAETARAPH